MPFSLIMSVSGDPAWTMVARLRCQARWRKDGPGDFDPGIAEWLVWRDRASVLRFAGYSGVMSTVLAGERSTTRRVAESTVFSIILALGFSHFLNDMMQSLLPALYPMLKGDYGLSFAQIGMITLVSQLISSILQPAVGWFADHRPQPYSLAVGMGVTFIGLLLLASAGSYPMLVLAAALVGVGSAVFHPEASRVARMASGGRHGLAQSLFQVGGNVGSSLGPVLAAFIVIPKGQSSIGWFSAAALLAMAVLFRVGNWFRRQRAAPPRSAARRYMAERPRLSRRHVGWSIAILLTVIFSKSFYTTSLNSYYTFYLISRFDLPIETAQIYLFAFLASVAVGTLIGGPVGDRIGRKAVIWVSIVGVSPFTLVLPHANLFWTGILTVVIGMTLASASSAIIVYALELVPGRIGAVAGLFFGLSFGMAGIGAAVLGRVADATSIDTVYQVCAFLPAIGLLTALLPDLGRPAPQLARP
jgi:FSR family fosmidomycin resistance protein-like MFS transporter